VPIKKGSREVAEFSVVGKRLPKLDALEKVTGRARYCNDLSFPGMLYGKIVRSVYPHAEILSIETSRAEALAGVEAVITANDTPKIKYVHLGGIHEDKLPLADGRVRYIGDEIAAVAAVDLATAEKAASLIRVTYRRLPAVFDPEEAMKPGAPLLHDEKPNNIAATNAKHFGNVDKAFEEADLVVQGRYVTQAQAHACIEPRSCVALFESDGSLKIWTATQSAYFVQKELSHVLGLPLSKVRVLEVYVGAGFGARSKVCEDEGICAFLARKAGKPVKITFTREEEFATTRVRHPMTIDLKTGVKRDGTIVAREARIITENGAYNHMGPAVSGVAGAIIASLYRVPNVRYEILTVYTNKHFGGPFRGYGNPQATFAIESQLDEIAERLGIDPLEIRVRNANLPGDVTPVGWKITESCGFRECLIKAGQMIDWENKRRNKTAGRGIGIAGAVHLSGFHVYADGDYSSALVKVYNDGSVELLVGSTDMGTGSRTALGQIAAEELGVGLGCVTVVTMDTSLTPMDLGSWGSRVVFIGGNAVKKAAADARGQLLEIAAHLLDVGPRDLYVESGRIFVKEWPEKSVSFSECVAAVSPHKVGNMIIGKGHYESPTDLINRETGVANISAAPIFAAQAAEVEVDERTGRINVVKIAAAHDVGLAINPTSVEGQIEGAVAQGYGLALTENFEYDGGRILNPGFMGYKIPRADDIPTIASAMIEIPEQEGPFGAKGVGEPGSVPTAPAIANAVFDAVGVRIRDLPITPEKIIRELEEADHIQ
jgi:4-hydroxybenzoyl-CoA reductase alpha subunit